MESTAQTQNRKVTCLQQESTYSHSSSQQQNLKESAREQVLDSPVFYEGGWKNPGIIGL
jgi:hypothetical protein